MSDEQEPEVQPIVEELDVNEAIKMLLFSTDFISALRVLQDVDEPTLQAYLMDHGRTEVNTLMRDLVVFEAKTSKDFLRGMSVGIAATIVDYDHRHLKGHGVLGTLRACLALLRNTNTDIITGRDIK